MNKKIFIILPITFLFISLLHANVKLPGIIADNMVLQRNISNKIWGWADKGEFITVTFKNKKYQATANVDGRWIIKLDIQEAGGPFEMNIVGKDTINLKNILIGDVWICSGQSNMEWKMGWLGEKTKPEIETAVNSEIRLIDVANNYDYNVIDDAKINKNWTGVNKESLSEFSAVAYYFAKKLYEKYKVPIGLISSEWGGTPCQAWTSYEGLAEFPNYLQIGDKLKTITKESVKKERDEKLEAWKKKPLEMDFKNNAWIDVSTVTTDWKTINTPGNWEANGLVLDGIVYLRKEITLTKEDLKKPVTLYFPSVDDIDTTYFNGVNVGSTSGYDKQRKYIVNSKLLKAGINIILIKVIDTNKEGGIVGDAKDFKVQVGTKFIPLAGTWKYKVSVDFKDLPPNPVKDDIFPNDPTILYNAMIAPLVDYGIKGAIWYQGEANAGKAYEYRKLFPAMITDWRNKWGLGNFPFLYVQLANFMKVESEPKESEWAELREAQNMTLSLPNTGQAVIIDIGEANDIHPKNKMDVGYRLALNAMKIAYNDKNIVYSGPTYKSKEIEGDKIKITFDNVGSGLEERNGELKYFAIAGEDKKFVWAKAKIEKNTVIVWSENIKNPIAVRYAWADNPEGCNLYNKEGLPASPFRTDDWDGITKVK